MSVPSLSFFLRPTTPAMARLILLALGAVFSLLLWLGALAPLATWKADRLSTLQQERSALAGLEQRVTAMARESAALSSREDLGIAWQADRRGAATARVQSELNRLATTHGVTLRAIAPVRVRALPGLDSAGFRIEGEAPLDRLVPFLVTLDHHGPALMIEKATLRRLTRPGAPTAQPVLFVQMDLLVPMRLSLDTEGGE